MKIMHVFQKALLGRIKQINYFDVGPVFEAMFAISRPFLPEKIKKRVYRQNVIFEQNDE